MPRITTSLVRRTLLALAAGAAISAPAFAADAVIAEPVFEVEPTVARSILLGAGVGVAPRYEGSDEYRVFGFPIASFSTGSDGPRRFEFRALDDIRLHVLRAGGFSAGPLAGYKFGRDEDDADLLAGLGDVDGGVVGGAFIAYDIEVSPNATVGVDLAVSHQFTGDARDNLFVSPGFDNGFGYEVDFGASANLDLSPRANLALRAGVIYADDDYMQTHFGISPLQAASSAAAGPALPAFTAEGGIKNAYVNANLAFDVTERFQVRAGAGYSRLFNDAADSPISVSDNQFTGSLGAAYRFQF